MPGAIASFVVMGLGVLLILIGICVSLAEWKRQQQRETGRIRTDELALKETLEGLAKLADALKGHRLGMQLIIAGMALILIGGSIGAASCL